MKPTDPLDVLRHRVPFFKTFLLRRYQVVHKETGKVISDFNHSFEELGLKNGATVVLTEAGKANKAKESGQENPSVTLPSLNSAVSMESGKSNTPKSRKGGNKKKQ